MTPACRAALAAALFAALAAPRGARGAPYRLTPADRAEVERVLRAFFAAARDGDAGAAAALVPTRGEFGEIFQPGTGPFIERHQRAVERDVRELRARFAGGAWVGLAAAWGAGGAVDLGPCGRFGAAASRCAPGPVIEWRVGARTERLRVDRLVRVRGRWKVFDPRL